MSQQSSYHSAQAQYFGQENVPIIRPPVPRPGTPFFHMSPAPMSPVPTLEAPSIEDRLAHMERRIVDLEAELQDWRRRQEDTSRWLVHFV